MLIAKTNEALHRGKSAPPDDDVLQRLIARTAETSAGIAISPRTALEQSTVSACVSMVSGIIASLPLKLMRHEGDERTQVTDHPAIEMMHRPNDQDTGHDFMRALASNMELWGDGYAYKIRTGDGQVRQLRHIASGSVSATRNRDFSITYTVGDEHYSGEQYDEARIFHARGLSIDGWQGMSPVRLNREIIALAIQVQRHGSALFKNGAQLKQVLRHPKSLSDQAYDRLQESIRGEFAGAANAWKTMLLEEGMEIDAVGMTGQESQFIEVQKWLVGVICAIWGIPSFVMNDSDKTTTWGSGLETITSTFKKFSLEPRLNNLARRFDHEFLLPGDRDLHFQFDTTAFTAGELKERYDAYSIGIQNEILNPNEARAFEGMNPYEGGEEYRNRSTTPAGGEDNSEGSTDAE